MGPGYYKKVFSALPGVSPTKQERIDEDDWVPMDPGL